MSKQIDVVTLRNRSARGRWNRTSIGDIFDRLKYYDPESIVFYASADAVENPEHQTLRVGRADDLANQYANAVLTSGITPGSIIMMLCENSVEAFIAKIGMAKAGVTVAPVNPNLAPDIIKTLIDQCEPSGVAMDSEFSEKLAPLMKEKNIPIIHYFNIGTNPKCTPSFMEYISNLSASEPRIDIGGDDIWQLLFTSGSTSVPKGVMTSHHNTMYNALSYNALMAHGLEFESQLVVCTFLPIIYHVSDLFVFSALLMRGKIVLGRKFDSALIVEALENRKVTCLWAGAPHAIKQIINSRKLIFGNKKAENHLKSIIYGWAPLVPEDYYDLKALFGQQVKLIEIIGQTEVCCAHRFWTEEHLDIYERGAPIANYVGVPSGLLACALMSQDGNIIGKSEQGYGEAIYRSPSLMAGYFNRLEETQAVIQDDWFHGGDAFSWGEAGQRMVVDRFKDIIKSGGENVTCIRVEAAISAFPGILRAAVVGLAHERWGEAVTAFVVQESPDTTLDIRVLDQFVRSRLAAFEVPKRYIFVGELPSTVGGKIQKHLLKAKYRDLYKGQI